MLLQHMQQILAVDQSQRLVLGEVMRISPIVARPERGRQQGHSRHYKQLWARFTRLCEGQAVDPDQRPESTAYAARAWLPSQDRPEGSTADS